MPFLLEKCKKYRHKFVEAPNYQGASLVAQTVKNPPAMQETWVQSLGREDPLENGVATHFGILTGKPHGEWSLVGCSPWGRKES